ncbi:MAG: hypothetical protein ACRDRV_01315 [Pseudonocardiaceae bacterium]
MPTGTVASTLSLREAVAEGLRPFSHDVTVTVTSRLTGFTRIPAPG